MKLIFSNAQILTGKEFKVVRGYLVAEDGKITEIGKGKAPYKNAFDLKGSYIFPSFTNAHVHLGDSIAQDLGAYECIEKRVGKNGIKFKVLEKNISPGISYSLKEMLSYGITAFCDFREGGIKGIEEIKRCLKKGQDAVILGRPDGSAKEVLERCDGIGISSVEDYSEEELRNISRTVKKAGKILAVHAGEVKDDVKAALKLKPDFLVHLTNVREHLDLVFSSNVPVVLCPRANAMLGIGIPNLKEIFENSLVALGTDNVMVNSLDMFREMDFTFKVLRGLYKNYKFPAIEVLKAATIHGREILKFKSNSIEPGNECDFIIIRRRKYLYDPILAIVHRLGTQDIQGIVKGERCIRKY